MRGTLELSALFSHKKVRYCIEHIGLFMYGSEAKEKEICFMRNSMVQLNIKLFSSLNFESFEICFGKSEASFEKVL